MLSGSEYIHPLLPIFIGFAMMVRFPLDGDPFLDHFKESIVNIILSAVQIKIPFSGVLAA
jgi:hypothetical protein